MKLKLHISPCPNDTFMFYALVHHLVDTQGLEFDLRLADIEELNASALRGEPDVSKISYGVYPELAERYALLTAGSALGFGVGPLLVAKQPIDPQDITQCRVALPGPHTTAHMLFSSAFPSAQRKQHMLFSSIEEAVLQGEADAGVIIHESRFTYASRGLHRVLDLGQWWEQQHSLPVPLGGIAVRRSLPPDVQQALNRALRASVELAMAQPHRAAAFVAQHAQEMSPEVQRQHIALYVNQHSINLDALGQQAIAALIGAVHFDTAQRNIFVPQT